jgi:hypothetical protein
MASYEKAKSLLTRGISRPTLYSVNIPRLTSEENEYLQLFCKSVSIPGISHEVVTVLGQENLGVQRDQPVSVKFGADGKLDLEVIENSNFDMYKAFRKLFDQTAEGSNPGSGSVLGLLSGISSSRTQRMKYYDNYVFDMNISKLEFPDSRNYNLNILDDPMNNNYRKVQTFNFVNTYVTSISEMALASDAFNSFLTFKVRLNFETYSTQ